MGMQVLSGYRWFFYLGLWVAYLFGFVVLAFGIMFGIYWGFEGQSLSSCVFEFFIEILNGVVFFSIFFLVGVRFRYSVFGVFGQVESRVGFVGDRFYFL